MSHKQSNVVDFLFIVTSIVGVCNCSMFCCTLLYVHSSVAIILMGKRELIALLNLSSWCLVMVERLFLAVPRGCLQFVIVVFPDHTHLLFYIAKNIHCCCFALVQKLKSMFLITNQIKRVLTLKSVINLLNLLSFSLSRFPPDSYR